MIKQLSSQGKGPNSKALYNHYASLAEFNEKAEEEYWAQMDVENQDREFWRDEAKIILAENDSLFDATANMEEALLLETVARFHLATKLAPTVEPPRRLAAALREEPDYIMGWIIRNNPKISMAEIENTASVLRIFNILWPMYRFQNVDLAVR
jgi:hypothetical protein